MSDAPCDYDTISVAAYADKLGSNAATPGGGSAAAVVLCLAANCAAKAAVFSGMQTDPQVHAFYEKCKAYAQTALKAAAADESTFAAWGAARKLPKETPDEQLLRTNKVNEAVAACISVPYQLALDALAFLADLETFEPLCKKWLYSDWQTARSFARSAYEAAKYNIAINLDFLHDEELKQTLTAFLAERHLS